MKVREVLKRLKDAGCRDVRQTGSHIRFDCPCGKHCTTVPNHGGGEDVKLGTLKQIEKDMEPCLGKKWLTKK